MTRYIEIGSVRLVEEKFPEIFWNGIWTPICGDWFWNNDYGADLFCQKLDSKYVSGTVTMRQDIKLIRDGIRIGKCNINDSSLLSCTGGCNDLETGNRHCAVCGAGQLATINIKCHESKLTSQLFFILYQETKKIENSEYLPYLKNLSSELVSKIIDRTKNMTFDDAVKVFDNVDPKDLPILNEYDDYYDEDYEEDSGNNGTFDNPVKDIKYVNQNDLPILKEYVDYDENHLEIWEKILKNGYKPYWVHGYEQDSSPVKNPHMPCVEDWQSEVCKCCFQDQDLSKI